MSHRLNIVLVTTDQQRADFTAGDGFPLDTMPFLDALAAGGTRFRRAYTTAPACVPARTSLLTGRYPSAHRVRQNSATGHAYHGDDLLDVLRAAGYVPHFAGKPHMYRGADDFATFAGPYMHTGGPRTTDEQREFDAWLAALDHHVASSPTPFPLECQLPYRIVGDAIAAIDAHADGQPEGREGNAPFFLWLSFPEPHNPYQAPEPYFSMFGADEVPDRLAGPEVAEAKGGTYRWLRRLIEEKRPGYDEGWRHYRAVYCGMLRMLDDQLRRFVEHLEARGLRDDTLLLFTSDHGDYVGEYGLQRKGAGMPECLMRVPFVAAGPGVVARDNTADFVSLVDVLPTLCGALALDIPLGVQGRDLWPLLTGGDYPMAEFASIFAERGFGGLPYGPDERPPLHFPYEGTTFDELNSVTQSGSTKMLRRGDWKLLYDGVGCGELYDLAADPAELDNRFDDPALQEVRATLLEELLGWTIRVDDDLPEASYTPKRVDRNWRTSLR